MEKRHLLIIIESLLKGDEYGKTILCLARETGIPASHVSKCVAQYSELFEFPDSGKYVAVDKLKLPKENWRSYVVKTVRHDTQSDVILWIGGGLTVLSAVFFSFVGFNLF